MYIYIYIYIFIYLFYIIYMAVFEPPPVLGDIARTRAEPVLRTRTRATGLDLRRLDKDNVQTGHEPVPRPSQSSFTSWHKVVLGTKAKPNPCRAFPNPCRHTSPGGTLFSRMEVCFLESFLARCQSTLNQCARPPVRAVTRLTKEMGKECQSNSGSYWQCQSYALANPCRVWKSILK